jgi:hypothetical protein
MQFQRFLKPWVGSQSALARIPLISIKKICALPV